MRRKVSWILCTVLALVFVATMSIVIQWTDKPIDSIDPTTGSVVIFIVCLFVLLATLSTHRKKRGAR